MKLHVIDTELFKLDGGAMFGVVPKSIWNKLNPADENNLCTWAMRCLLIEDGNKLVLIDTGIGNKQSEKFFSHYYLHGPETLGSSFKAAGFSFDDVTDVVMTHLHFDHCGGSVKREGDSLKPAFKNATYWSTERHWKWATQPNDREKASFLAENILPVEQAGQLRFVREPAAGGVIGSDILPDLSFRVAEGHTASMLIPQIRYNDTTLVYMADLLPSAGHVPLPYVMAYDMFPLTTLHEKKAFLEEAAANNYTLFFEHDPVNECCTLEKTEKGIRAGKAFALADL